MDSFIVNALQANFESVLNMDDVGMVKMFRSLEQSGLRAFLGILGSVFEEALSHFFANASVNVDMKASGKAVAEMKVLVQTQMYCDAHTHGDLNTDLTKIKDNKNSNYKINVAETQAFDKHSHAATGSHSTTHLLRHGLTCTKKASEPRGSAGKTGSKWVYLVTHAMSLFDLRDVCMVIGSLATLDLPMVVDLIGIFVLKGPYCTLTMTNWFLQALSVIPRGSWDDVARRFTMIRWYSTGEVGKADLGEFVALHPLKVLNNKSVLTYMKKNQAAPQGGEGSKTSGDKAVVEPNKEKVVKKKIVIVSSAAPAKSKSETSSDEDKRPLAMLGAEKTDRAEETEDKRPKLVKTIQAVEENAVSNDLPRPVQPDSEQASQQSTAYGSGMVFALVEIREINWATHFLPKIDPAAKGKEILEAFARSNPVEEHCYCMAKVEDEFLSWAETERMSELLKRRLLVQCRLYEKELQEAVYKHRAEFDTAAPSANYDHMCIRFLECELKEIIKQHRF
ncbi:hypothetical protein F511_20637 [Dorcoceras hygrometricum]|uniref:Uncharacterized protein n=1 Tax=Dorcoceras hygrometricum TaxID=472368 RepID=A0A2Z7A858_9LAMI|nr:hypothetical protein F511_20637 [Dorcoceras hygrometricum]